MEFLQNQGLKQELKTKLSPLLYQSVRLLALPLSDLRLEIGEELSKNPLLEAQEREEAPLKGEDEDDEDRWSNASDPGVVRHSVGDPDSHRAFIEGVLTSDETLYSHLNRQLALEEMTVEERDVATLLIGNLDDNGFHCVPPEEVIPRELLPYLPGTLDIVQSLDPPGLCTAGPQEALIIQAEKLEDAPPGAVELLKGCYEEMLAGKWSAIRRYLGIGQEALDTILGWYKKLNPFPGASFSSAPPRYIKPDITIIPNEEGYSLRLNEEDFPLLTVNENLELSVGNKDKDTNKYLMKCVSDARRFIGAVEQRNRTLLKTASAIMEVQKDFLKDGAAGLKPLTLKEIAEALNIHISTVSRATNGKYIETPRGIFELKYFLMSGISTQGEKSSISRESVKEMIREIRQKNPGKKVSDNAISKELEGRGITIARRTVAKYRQEMDKG